MSTITVRLIFVNYDGKPKEICVPTNWHFKDLKKHILTESWPANYIEIEQVDRLRLFSSGRELEDSRTVQDLSSLASTAGFAAVHVTVVNKSSKSQTAESSVDQSKASTGCSCCIM